MTERWSDPVRGGMGLLLSALFHVSLFMTALQLSGPARRVSLPVEIEIITATRPPAVERLQPLPPAKVLPTRPERPVTTVLPTAPSPESVPAEPAAPMPESAGLPTETVPPVMPSEPAVSDTKAPVYTPLTQVSRLPTFKTKVEPVYPELARRLEKEGTVMVEVTISESGDVMKAEVVQELGFGFDEAAKAAMERSRFEPARAGDRPVAVVVRIPIRFRFKD
ncbi:MAG: energy transducer TonB [Nitrospirae bacterium]|nr:energy transducer TonB [Nitrospirota bacterium]